MAATTMAHSHHYHHGSISSNNNNHSNNNTRLYSVPTPDGDVISISSSELPDAVAELVEVLRAVAAPLAAYAALAAEYYRQRRWRQYEGLAAAGIAVGEWSVAVAVLRVHCIV